MPTWIIPVLDAANNPDLRAWLLALLLILVVDRRLTRLVISIERITLHVLSSNEQQSAWMKEIRDTLYNLAGRDIPPDTPTSKPGNGVDDAS